MLGETIKLIGARNAMKAHEILEYKNNILSSLPSVFEQLKQKHLNITVFLYIFDSLIKIHNSLNKW